MEYSLFASLLSLQIIFLNPTSLNAVTESTVPLKATDRKPLLLLTWQYTESAERGWEVLFKEKGSALDAVEETCATCEDIACREAVGFGNVVDEHGEATLDSLIMDGQTMDVGAVCALRNISNAVRVARKVMEHTEHTLLAGELATEFAVKMGFKKISSETPSSKKKYKEWLKDNCQPNFWKNVVPNPLKSCGPYTPTEVKQSSKKPVYINDEGEINHDTIGVIALDINGHIAAATSTNGLIGKIPGRVGDSPIPGAGGYADSEVGAASETGNGDILMRFSSSFLVVEEMRRGAHPQNATETVINRIRKYYPELDAGIIALDKHGNYGASCYGIKNDFYYYVANAELNGPSLIRKKCLMNTEK